MSDERKARRALRRAARRERRAGRRERRQERRAARREDLAALLTPLIEAAEILIADGADRLDWVLDQFLDLVDLVDLPGIDEDELEDLLEGVISTIVARLFP